MKKWGCSECGYIYDPQLGDVENGIRIKTDFDDLPEDWVCPDCGADKDSFDIDD